MENDWEEELREINRRKMEMETFKQAMMRIVDTLPPADTFLLDTFFARDVCFSTESVLADKKEIIPALVSAERSQLTADDSKELLREDIISLHKAITNREEWLAAKILFEGKVAVEPTIGCNRLFDFGFSNNIFAKVPWSDSENSRPLENLLEAKGLVFNSGYSSDIMIADSETINNLIRSKSVKTRPLQDEIKVVHSGVVYYGCLMGLHTYSYNQEFSDNGEVSTLVPAGKVFVGSTNMKSTILYGAVKNYEGIYRKEKRISRIWYDGRGKRYIQLSSRPLPCPKDVSAWVVLEV